MVQTTDYSPTFLVTTFYQPKMANFFKAGDFACPRVHPGRHRRPATPSDFVIPSDFAIPSDFVIASDFVIPSVAPPPRPPYNVPPATFENDKVLERKRKNDKVLERVAFSERRGFGFGFGFRTQQCLYILYLQTGSKRNPAEPTNFNGETLGAKKPLRRWNSKPFRFPLMILTPRNHP